jgi:hypothetical protein
MPPRGPTRAPARPASGRVLLLQCTRAARTCCHGTQQKRECAICTRRDGAGMGAAMWAMHRRARAIKKRFAALRLFACVIACALRPTQAPPARPAPPRTSPARTTCGSWAACVSAGTGRNPAGAALSAGVVRVVVRHAGVHLWCEPVLQACQGMHLVSAWHCAEHAAVRVPSSGFMPRHFVHAARPIMLPAWPTTACGPCAVSSPNATGTLSSQGAAERALAPRRGRDMRAHAP